MAGYVECLVPGGGRAFIDVGTVSCVLIGEGMTAWDNAEPTKPIRIMFRAGETIDVFGTSVGVLLVKLHDVKAWLKNNPQQPIKVLFLDETQNG